MTAEEKNVIQALNRFSESLLAIRTVFENIDEHDHKIMVRLREKYAAPQTLASMSLAAGEYMKAVGALVEKLSK